MKPKKLLLTPFRKALSSLDEALQIKKVDEIVRDATIQRFEYTYELAWKMIERHLVWMGVSDVRSFSKRDLFREAARIGLLENAEAWFGYNNARNQTSHTYNEQIAEEVFEIARAFAPAARRLLEELEKTHD